MTTFRPAGAERDLDRFGELVDAALECRARVHVEMQFLGCHDAFSPRMESACV